MMCSIERDIAIRENKTCPIPYALKTTKIKQQITRGESGKQQPQHYVLEQAA